MERFEEGQGFFRMCHYRTSAFPAHTVGERMQVCKKFSHPQGWRNAIHNVIKQEV
jgi:hypothetical protein